MLTKLSKNRRSLGLKPLLIMLMTLTVAAAGLTKESALAGSDRPTPGNYSATVIKKVFANGLTLLIKPNPANEVVAVNLMLKMGLNYEPLDKLGISSLLQRVLTKGTATMSAAAIAEKTEATGSSIGAGIGAGSGNVTLRTTVSGLESSLPIFLDLVQNPSFPEEEVAKEKMIRIQQLAALDDQPTNIVFNNYFTLLYGDHPQGALPEKIVETTAGLTREDLVSWHRRTYVPENMVVSVVGKVEPETIIASFAQTLGKLPKGSEPLKLWDQVPAKDRNLISVKEKNIEGLFLVLGYPAPDHRSEDAPIMDVLTEILGGGMGSRLFRELRDKQGLAYSVNSGYWKTEVGSSIYVFMATAPENYRAARDGIIAEFDRLINEPVSISELETAKRSVKGQYLMNHETNAAQGTFLARYESSGFGYGYDDIYPRLIEKVTPADLQRVADQYFKNYCLSVLTPVALKE
ncbi:MAG: M16 family metallopeptidase [Bacteroidota bacterium]